VPRRAAPKYVVDTQLFIHAFRDSTALELLQQFHERFAPFEYLSVIVAQELRAGVRRAADAKALERHLFQKFQRVHRIVSPSPDAWHHSGDVMAAMAKREGLELARMSKAFSNDVLLAASCRESGCVLVTENVRDFSRIQRFIEFAFTPPWP
jgi:predicted nucleic acid-binding protein